MIEGMFEGNSPSDLQAAQTWLGSNVGAVTAFTGQSNWSDYVSSVGYEQGLWAGSGKTMLWSIPLFANGANLHDAGTGAYDSYYTKVAEQLASGQSGGPIYVRTGWEFNGSWQPWSAISNPADYIAAFRDFVTAFRAVSDRFVFTWAPNIGDQGMNPAAAYPGDKYVDIIGVDSYQQGAGDTFANAVNQTYGLQWLSDFATQHGKPIAIPEWGVNADPTGAYVTAASAWMTAHNVVYESYWDSNSNYAGKLSDGEQPGAGAAFRTAFAAPVMTSLTATVIGGGDILSTGAGATISVAFSKAVTVTGAPQLTLSDGEVATYAGGAGSSTLTFSYVAQPGYSTADLKVTGVAMPQGSSITDTAGTAVNGSIAGDLGLVVDALHPTVTGVTETTSTGAASLHPGDHVTISLALNEAVQVTGSPSLVLNDGETASFTGGSGTAALSFNYTVASGDASTDLQITSLSLGAGGAVADLAGNSLTAITAADLHLSVSAAPAAVAAVHAPMAEDFDGDGKADILWRAASGEMGVWESSHGLNSASSVDLGHVDNSWSVAGVGDFDGDGKTDILWRNANGETGLWESSHGLNSSSFVDLGHVDSSWSVAGVGDFDGDGKADVLWRNANGETGLWESSHGLNSSSFIDLGHVDSSWSVAGVGDFDGDGKTDILWRNANGETGLWESSHGLNSSSFIDLGKGPAGASLVGVGDFDGDGKADILWLSANEHLILWGSTNGLQANSTDLGALPAGSHIAAINDFNGDGSADLLVQNSNGDTSLWLSNGHLGFTIDDLGTMAAGGMVESALHHF